MVSFFYHGDNSYFSFYLSTQYILIPISIYRINQSIVLNLFLSTPRDELPLELLTVANDPLDAVVDFQILLVYLQSLFVVRAGFVIWGPEHEVIFMMPACIVYTNIN